MNRIWRYILSELIVVFGFALSAMTAFIIIAVVGQEALRQGLGPVAIMQLIPYMLPSALMYAVPGTILFAFCSVYGRMSAENEIVAVKSLGISPVNVFIPGWILAFFVSLVTVWLNDLAKSWGRDGASRVVVQSVEEVAYGMLRTRQSYGTGRFSIVVEKVKGRRLIHPTVMIYNANKAEPFMLMAKEAELTSDLKNNMLVVELHDGEMDYHGEGIYRFDHETYHIPLRDASKKGRDVGRPENLPMTRIPQAVQNEEDNIQQIQQALAAEAAFQFVTGDFDSLTSSQWNANQQDLIDARWRIARLELEPWRRWANGFSCLCFVFVGAPLAVRLRNADLFTSFGFCFLPILIVYYPILMSTVDRAKSGAIPPYCVWLSNLVLLVVGLLLMRRVYRY